MHLIILHLIYICILFSNRDNSNSATNPAYCINTETSKGVLLPGCEVHINDTIKGCDDIDEKQETEPKNKAPSNIYRNVSIISNKNADCVSIKSDDVPDDQSKSSCTIDTGKENKVYYYNNPKPQLPKPKHVNKPIAKPPAATKDHCCPPANKNLPTKDEYFTPNALQIAEDSQYALLNPTEKAENNQYTLLDLTQRAETNPYASPVSHTAENNQYALLDPKERAENNQ